MTDLKYPATRVVFWPGQEVYTCEEHYQKLLKLNDVMGGVHLSSRDLENDPEPRECSNCTNENRVQKSS